LRHFENVYRATGRKSLSSDLMGAPNKSEARKNRRCLGYRRVFVAPWETPQARIRSGTKRTYHPGKPPQKKKKRQKKKKKKKKTPSGGEKKRCSSKTSPKVILRNPDYLKRDRKKKEEIEKMSNSVRHHAMMISSKKPNLGSAISKGKKIAEGAPGGGRGKASKNAQIPPDNKKGCSRSKGGASRAASGEVYRDHAFRKELTVGKKRGESSISDNR